MELRAEHTQKLFFFIFGCRLKYLVDWIYVQNVQCELSLRFFEVCGGVHNKF